MTHIYSVPHRKDDPYALPDVEVFENTAALGGFQPYEPGWYWWYCFPGCLPDGEPNGPFDTEAEAIADAQSEDAYR